MKLFPKLRLPQFPSVGVIPAYSHSPIAAYCLLTNAVIITAVYLFIGDTIIAIFSLVLLGLKFLLLKRKTESLGNVPLIILFVLSLSLIIVNFGGWSGSRTLIALLITLLALKLLETKSIRGYFISSSLMYFIAAIIFVYESSSTAIVFLCAYCVTTTACLALLSQPEIRFSNKPLLGSLKESGKILLQAIPLTLILFFLFPRIQSNFGFLPGDVNNNKPGFENFLRSGDISGRSFSNELAFRAEFTGQTVPQSNQLYWRSKVFSKESQFSWLLDERVSRPLSTSTPSPKDTRAQSAISYSIIHQPSSDKNLPVLDSIQKTNMGKLYSDHTVKIRRGFDNPTLYKATAVISNSNNTIQPYSFKPFLQTSIKPKAKTRQLMQQWQNKANNHSEIVNLVLQHFRQQPFKYNLIPPNLKQNQPVEDFLFNTQSGYCEHYSSTFTLLMRWMNIPARVVVGFQGGDWVPQGQFFEVRYSDAHAWSEVWIKGKGWTRVDPTAAVAPERIEFGMDAMLKLMAANQMGTGMSGSKLADFMRPRGFNKMLQSINQMVSSASHTWDKWVVNFSSERQTELLKSLNLGDDHKIAKLLSLLLSLIGLVVMVILWRLRPRKPKMLPIDDLYQQFLNKLQRVNVDYSASEGPISFGQRAASQLPHNETDILQISQYYIQAKYSNQEFDITTLKDAIQRFKPSVQSST